MKNTNFKLKTKVLNRAVSITALLLAAGLLFTGCPQKVKEEPKPVYYTVNLVHEGGSLTAAPAIQDGKALKDSEITFTAIPANASTHEVDKWEITGGQVVSGGEDESISVKVKITANTTVKVTFKKKDTVPTDKTCTVGAVGFTMKGIAAVDASLGHNDYNNNKPHTVSLSAYLIGETEVTQELWQAVMGNNPSFFDGSSGMEPAEGERQGKRPVESVNWYQAIAFCNKLSIKLNLDPCYTVNVGGTPVDFAALSFDQIPTGNNADWNKAELDMNKSGFRLPTEAEWEWAAKGGTDDKWAGTDTEAELKNYAWYNSNSGDKTHEVKKKTPNGYGLYDMSGNVWEWCWDWYDDTLPALPGADYAGLVSGSYRVLRGGSWYYYASYCPVGLRYNYSPDFRDFDLGFRLACRP